LRSAGDIGNGCRGGGLAVTRRRRSPCLRAGSVYWI
jgi:hypothetical protein